MLKCKAKSITVLLLILSITRNISIGDAQFVPDLQSLGKLIQKNFGGYTTQNTRTYTLLGNGGNIFPLDKDAALPIPQNAAGPLRTLMPVSPSGYPYQYQKASPESPGWQPSNINPYSYMQGHHQGRADFSHEVEQEGDIITVDDLPREEQENINREIEIQSSMSLA